MQDKEFIEDFISEVRNYQPSLPPPSLLELISYEELPFLDSSERGDQHTKFRMSVLYVLYESFSLEDRAFIRFLLEQEITYHSYMRGFDTSIKVCAFLLFSLAEVEDIQLLWKAKTTSFDTMHGLDDQILVGAGISATLEYLQRAHEPWSEQARKYIEKGHQFNDDELARYREKTNMLIRMRASTQ